MSKKTTEELEHILSSASGLEAGRYLQEQSEELLTQPRAFRDYMHRMLRKYGKSQQEVFLQADLPEARQTGAGRRALEQEGRLAALRLEDEERHRPALL